MSIQTPWVVRNRQRGDLVGMVVDRITTQITIKPATETSEAEKAIQVLIGVNWSTIGEDGLWIPEAELPSPSYHTPSEIVHTGEYPILDALRSIDETLQIAGDVQEEDETEGSEEGNGGGGS